MRKITALLLFFTLISFSQTDMQKANKYLAKKGEVFFEFAINNKLELNELTTNLSIINFDSATNIVQARANRKEFDLFMNNKYSFTVKKEANETGFRQMFERKNQSKVPFSYTAYPTYTEYLAIMADFEVDYPNICKKIEIGTSVQNRKLLAVKLSDNVSVHEQEPRFLYVSTMHGDETTGFPIMLRLIEYLLDNYGSDSEITDLLNNNEIYISPLHNPDGTYAGGNNTVSGATRGNANFIDLNRNFPDPEDGIHSDGNSYEPETLAYMAFAEQNHFTVACNFHGGTEVVNYPWDTFEALSAEDDWWKFVSREYADEVHLIDSGYMSGFNNGITNGWDWYQVQGGRQDYMNYYMHAKEVTIEISNQKNPPGSQLPYYWDTNKEALIKYMKQVTYGIRGVVTDAVTGNAIKASVYINSKDFQNSWVETELPFGDYYRPIKGGTYQVTYAAPCYISQTVSVSVSDLNSATKNISLQPLAEEPIVDDVAINSGETATLSTTTVGTISWFETLSSTTPLATGNTFVTPNLTVDTSYFVENSVLASELQLTTPTSNTSGSFYNGTKALVFDCFEAIQLHKITVNAQSSGNFVMELLDNDGTVLQSGTFSVNGGIQEIIIDFDIPEGRDLRILRTSGVQLFRNNSNVNYPYELDRYINIKRSNANTSPFDYYYSFYNWKLQQPVCISNRVEVEVTVEGVVGLGNVELLNAIIMYPNPVGNTLRFSLTNTIEDFSISIYDLLGKQVITKKITTTQTDLSIDVSSLKKGVYFVNLKSGTTFVNKQLVVK